ncbi:hypothetical protein QWY14_13200 [Planococcus sp. N028]|uniref:Uncharacterized protein n=1 Tax=Planococcus shixiaomingii TaxID=3058393 RepID=A0ABT8N4W3_9BACL|nr:hypothetical protein [Planococcus sp. N028]MDN7242764.1 hypothetical protein [Planococcus sp. N028]
MRIQIICEKCSSIAEFLPPRTGEEVGIQTVNKNFRVGVNWKNEVIENVQEEFVKELSEVATNEERKELLEAKLTENAFAETIDFELSFTCVGCGDRITLNDFQLSDFIGF